MAAPADALVSSWKGIRGDDQPGAKALVAGLAASSSAALAAEAQRRMDQPRHRFVARTNRPEGRAVQVFRNKTRPPPTEEVAFSDQAAERVGTLPV